MRLKNKYKNSYYKMEQKTTEKKKPGKKTKNIVK